MRKRNIFSVSISFILCLSVLAGCGAEAGTDFEEVIELVEPVEAGIVGTESVVRRNLYDAEMYVGVVYPYVEEYSFPSNQVFDRFAVYAGDTVEKGDILAYADEENITEKIEQMEERLTTLTENYEEFCAEAEKTILDLEYSMEVSQWVLGNLDIEKPAEYITNANGAQTANPNYASWQKNYDKWLGEYTSAELNIDKTKQEMLEQKELYALDYAYYSGQLQDLKAQKKDGVITAQISGTIVGMDDLNPGVILSGGIPVIAVGDMNQKFLKCEFINERRINESAKLYAFIDGKKYDVVYQDDGNKTQTSFVVQDENNEVLIGADAVLVRIKKSSEQALTVSADAIYSVGTQKIVYVVENGEAVERTVKTGMSNGIYTEITSGLEEGEQILVSEVLKAGENTAVLETGDFTTFINEYGRIMYPFIYRVTHPFSNVTVYFEEHLVDYGWDVLEGTPLTRISTDGEELDLINMEQNLQREKERLADLIAAGNTNEETITRRQESIAQQEEELNELRAEYTATTINAPISGRIVDISHGFYEIVGSKSVETDKIAKNTVLAEIADPTVGFLGVANDSGALKYGEELNVTYTGRDGKEHATTGKVITLGGSGLSDSFGVVLIALPEGEIENVMESSSLGGGLYRSHRIRANGYVALMENVVLVPKKAVIVRGSATFVNVLQDDGSVVEVNFLAGGSDKDYYWVIEGLTEGMTVCWE